MKEFFKKLLSDSSEVSSKRFTSLYSLGLFTAVVIVSLFGIAVPQYIVYGLVVLITGSAALTLGEKIG